MHWGGEEKDVSKQHYPFLPIAVLKIIDVIVFPVDTHSEQCVGEEALFSIHGKIGQEGSNGLNNTCRREGKMQRWSELQSCTGNNS